MHPAQAEFCDSPALYRGFVGGRSAGKTWVGAHDTLCRASEGEPSRTYMIASPTGVILGDTTFPTVKKLGYELGLIVDVKVSPYPLITLSNGATIRFRTAEDPEKMRGPNLSGVWLDEASLMVEDAYRIAIASLREGGEQGWLSATYTPKGLSHWTYETFYVRAQQANSNTSHHRAHTRDNPFNPPGFADTLAGQYSPVFARQELAGEYLNIEGAEWPSTWFKEEHWFEAWPKPEEITLRVMAVDSSMGRDRDQGDYSAIIALARTRDGQLWIEADIDRRPVTQIIADGIAFARRFHRETGGPLDGFGVESDVFQQLVADEFRRQSKEAGIMLPVYEVFTMGDPKILRIRRLTPYLSAGNFRWRNRPGTQLLVAQAREFPVGEHDDGPDAAEMALRLAIDISWDQTAPRK